MSHDLTPTVQEQIIKDFKKDKQIFEKVYEHYYSMMPRALENLRQILIPQTT